MSTVDCLILGFYDYPFQDYVEMVAAMGTGSGAYQDLSLAFIKVDGRPMRALDVMSQYHRSPSPSGHRPFHNADFLWPVVTYLTSYLQRRGFAIDYVNLPHIEKEKLEHKLGQSLRAVAITTTLYVLPHPVVSLVSEVRRYNPDTKIIVGGPYISNQVHTLNRRELNGLFEYLGADIYVLCSEGEATLSALLTSLRNDSPLEFIPNLAFKNKQGSFTFTPECPESNALEENIIDYTPFLNEPVGEFLSIRTAKSCPFACAFCGFPERAGEYRFLDVAKVEKQLDAVAQVGTVSTLTFLDDTFNVPKGRFKEILRMMKRNGYNFKWNCFYRVDQGDDETIELMAQAGCEGVFLGVESGSDQMLARMNKCARRSHYLHAIPRLAEAGISTYASLIVGFPGETDETVRETIGFLEESAPDYYRAQLWFADPVTPIWKHREEYGITGVGFNWSHRTMSVRDACDWIERIFLQVNNSVWLPQFGFEQWSTFYLLRRGMTRERIRVFLRAFNAVIAYRLSTGADAAPEELLSTLRCSCQLDSDTRALSISEWSGSVYQNTLAAMHREFAGINPMKREDVTAVRSTLGERQTAECRLPYASVEKVLAAYACLLAGQDPSSGLLAYLEGYDKQPIPMRFVSLPEEGLEIWTAEAKSKIESFLPIRHFAMGVYRSRLWRRELGSNGDLCRYVFAWHAVPAEDPNASEVENDCAEAEGFLESWIDEPGTIRLRLTSRSRSESASFQMQQIARTLGVTRGIPLRHEPARQHHISVLTRGRLS